jgi:uncharacterized protein
MLEAHQLRLKALGVEKLGLFGSFVRGEQQPESDIDLLVEFTPGKKTFDAFMELCFFLEEILERKVEVVTVESLSPYIGPHILNEVEYVDLAAWNFIPSCDQKRTGLSYYETNNRPFLYFSEHNLVLINSSRLENKSLRLIMCDKGRVDNPINALQGI